MLKFFYDGKSKDAWAINKAHVSFFRRLFDNARKAEKISIRKFNSAGLIRKSLVWEYFVLKKKTFNHL